MATTAPSGRQVNSMIVFTVITLGKWGMGSGKCH